MVGLIDIAPSAETVSIRGQDVDVYGVSAEGVARLFSRFPELRKVFSGREVPVEEIIGMGGDIVSAIIAAGTGASGNAEAEEVARKLSIDEQVDLLSAILRVTLPKGVRPFVEKLMGMGATLGLDPQSVEDLSLMAQDTTSPQE